MNDYAIRILKTFVQAFIGAWLAIGVRYGQLFTVQNLKVGVAAGIVAALMNIRSLLG